MDIIQELETHICTELEAPLASLAKVLPWPEDTKKFPQPKGGCYCLVRYQTDRAMGEPAASAQKGVLRQTIRFLFELRLVTPALMERAKGYSILGLIKRALNAFAPTVKTPEYAVKLPGFFFLEQGLMPTKTQGVREFAAIYAVDLNYSKRR